MVRNILPSRSRRLSAWTAGVVLAAGLAVADSRSGLQAPTLIFEIAEQPLPAALETYSAVSGVAVLYESAIDAGQMSAPVFGEFTRETALLTLLGQTNLVARFSRADAVTLADPSAYDHDEPPEVLLGGVDMALDTLLVTGTRAVPTDQSALTGYIMAIQEDIRQALRRSPATSGREFRAGVELWVDATRSIARARLFRSTGKPELDQAVEGILHGLRFRQKGPADTPQPIKVMIVVKTM